MNYSNKIAIILISISLLSSTLYGIDKLTSSNSADASLIRIGLSNLESNQCQICQEGEIYYNSGCKRCIQDSVVIITHVNDDKHPILGWSKNDAISYGDKNCSGNSFFKKISIENNSIYWVEIIKNDLTLESNFYNDKNFSNLIENVKTSMCSNPSELQYLRISNEDGKPMSDGGKLYGKIDDIEIKNLVVDKEKILAVTFDECENKSCNGLWNLENHDRIFVNTSEKNINFFSEVSGTNDYATLKLEESLPNSWVLRFKLQIDEIEEHPHGKGILKLDPSLRQIFFGMPAIVLPFIGYAITRKIESNFVGLLISLSGIVILAGILLSLSYMTSQNIVIFAISILIIILGLFKIKRG